MKKERRKESVKKAGSSRESGSGTARVSGREGGALERLEGIPSWLPYLLYALATVLLFRDFVFSDRMLIGLDTFSLGYAARTFFAAALNTTGFPLWNPYILGGTPFIESLAGGDSLYPPSLLLLFLTETYRALGWKLVLHVFLAGVFMHLWLRALGVSRAGSMIGGLAFLTAPYLVTLVFPGHDGKLFVTALTPLLFLVTELALTRKGLHWPAAVGGVVALVILTTHFQMAYFLFGGVGAYAIFRTVERWREGARGSRPEEGSAVATLAPWPRFALFLAASLVGAGAAGVQLIPAIDYVSQYSRRTATTTGAEGADGVAYSSSWSLHPEEAVGLLVPEFSGGNTNQRGWTSGTYWGRNAFKLNHEYLGILTLLMAAISFLGAPLRRTRWFLVGLGGTAFLFAMGAHTPVWRLFYEVLPGVALFRAPGMAIFLTGFATSTLAGLGFDRGVTLVADGEEKRLLRVLGVGASVLLLGWLAAASGMLSSMWTAVFDPSTAGISSIVLAEAEPFIVRGFLVAFLLALALFLLWLGVARRILPITATAFLVALLVAGDQIRVDAAYIGTVEFGQFSAPDANHQYLIERVESEPPFRLFSMVGNGQDVTASMYGIELAAGHHPNDLLRYRELIGMEGSGDPVNLATFHPNVLRILNVRYILWPDEERPLDGAPDPLSRITRPDGTPYASVYPFPGLPRARVVGQAIVVPEDEVLDVILADHDITYDPFTQTVLSEEPPIDLGGGDATGSANWVDHTPNRLVLDVQSTGPALLVLSENWFPGWRATVDGEEVEVLRADHTLRAIPIGLGSQRVEFWFDPPLLRTGLWITIFCTLLLLGAAGWGIRGVRRR